MLTITILSFNICLILGQTDCPNDEDYSPCSCARRFDGVVSITCEEIPLAEVRAVFDKNTGFDLHDLLLYPQSSELIITANVLGLKHRITNNLRLYCPYFNGDYQLRIDPDAFASSKNSLQMMTTYHCDLARFNFDFLTGFDELNRIDIYYSTSVQLAGWATMPPLPGLLNLGIVESGNLNAWISFPNLVKGLDFVYLLDDGITDATMERILDWVLLSSRNSLTGLSVNQNALTRVPPQVASFSQLNLLSFDRQRTPPGLPSLSANSFNFASPVSYFSFSGSGLSTIQDGTFRGKCLYSLLLLI